MSFLVSAACVRMKAPGVAKNVLMQLADIANDQGYAWPSIDTLCMRTCWRRTAVIEALEWLERHHALQADRSNGRKTTYWLTPSRFTGELYPELSTERNRAAKRTGLTSPPRAPVCVDQSARRTEPVRQTDTNHQEQSRNTNTPQPPAEAGGASGFDAIAAGYPRRARIEAARRVWAALSPDATLQAEITRALQAWRGTAEWQREEGRFIPTLSDFLRNKRWLDAPGLGQSPPPPAAAEPIDIRSDEQRAADREAARLARQKASEILARAGRGKAVPA